jgi:folate-binding protein YgfZ
MCDARDADGGVGERPSLGGVREPFATWVKRDFVRASGPDTAQFLQGQLSQDVESLVIGASTWSLLLQPSGKVDAWLRVSRADDDEFVLDVDGGWGDAVLQRLSRFKLRTKCDLDLVEGWKCLAVRDTTADGPDGARRRLIVWPQTDGYDLVGPAIEPPEGLAIASPETYERRRIEAGVPAMGHELTEATIPVEAGQWLIDASVSFTKGCFTGQELVARIDSRGGNAPRPVRGVRIDGPAAAGDEVLAGGKVIGTVTSAATADGGSTVALAPLSRTVEAGTEVEAGGCTGTVVALPMA